MCVLCTLGLACLALTGPASAQSAAIGGPDPWHHRQVGLSAAAQEAGSGGRGVTVAVLDTWVDGTHADFGGRVRTGADCTGGTCRTGQTPDTCAHGTHVAGIVGASSFGAAPQVTVLPVQVLGRDAASGECTGGPQDVAAGIRYALDQGAQVLNLSLGVETTGTDDGHMSAAVEAAAAAGAVVVFSAGNGSVPVAEVYGSKALVVAATAPDGALASYSQRGGGVDLAAPGGDAVDGACTRSTCITSLFPQGQHAVAAGTSMSAPLVSGVAALLLAQQPDRTGQDVAGLLRGTATPLSGAGAGLLDAAAALGVTPGAPAPSAEQAVSLGPARPLSTDPAPIGLGVGALVLVVAAGTATVLAGRDPRS